MSQLAWKQIRKQCQVAGLPIEEWENELPDRLLTYLVTHLPGSSPERYHTDAVFHTQVHTVVSIVMACLLNHDPLTDPLLKSRVEELGDTFRSEIDTVQDRSPIV